MATVESPPANSTSIVPESWADDTCRDLLAVQAQNRQVPVEQRAELVEQRLRERIAAVEDAQRRDCLRALARRFPLPESSSGNGSVESAPQTPTDWVAAFDTIKDGMTPALQNVLLDKLKAAGCLPAVENLGVVGIPMPVAVESLLPKQPVDPARVAQLLDVVFEASRVLDGNFRRVWEGVADFGKAEHGLPRNSIEDMMRKFLIGDQDVPRVVLRNRIENVTKLIPAVLMAVKESWDELEADVGNCLPEEIQKRVKKSFISSYEADCWKEYVRVAEKLHPDVRVQEFFAQIVTKARAHIPR